MYTFMVMQLESKKFLVVDNIFSDKVLKILEPYAKLLPTDKSSYSAWPDKSTNNKTAPECFTCDITGKDRLLVIEELYNNPILPCYQKKWLKSSDIAIQKIPITGFIPKHSDYCLFSLTVFLSDCEGGEFCWWDENNTSYLIEPYINRGIINSYCENFSRGASHKVLPVQSGTRFTLQLFVFDKVLNTQQGAIIEDNINE